jgi:hypothetical protein
VIVADVGGDNVNSEFNELLFFQGSAPYRR